MSDLIRVAVIGTSWWAEGTHLPGLTARPDVDVVALCGRNPDRLRALAAKYNIPQTFTDYERLLSDVQPQVVVVVTPNHEHAPMTKAALEAGAHVICEKPLALTVTEAESILKLAERLKRRHFTFFTYRGMSAPRYVKHLIESDYLGALYHAQACYLHGSWLNPERLASWKTTLAQGGSGVLGDLGSHVKWWFGPAVRAVGTLSTFITERPGADGVRAQVETDDAAAFTLEFGNRGQATVQLSRVAAHRHNYQRFELYGSKGMLVYDYDQHLAHIGRVSGARVGEGEPKELSLPTELTEGLRGLDTLLALYRALTDPFFASLKAEVPTPGPNFADGLAVQKVIEAVQRSVQSGAWQQV
jgi:predicted dehydrogenase